MSWGRADPDQWKGSINGFSISAAKKLGEGAYGCVYAATIRFHDRSADYAVKVANDRLDGHFGRDAHMMQDVEIPGAIIPKGPFDLRIDGERDDTRALVMPLIQGRNLSERIGIHGRLTDRETISMLAETSRTLHRAHAHGFVHMDIKPANILVETKTQRYLTADWGEVHRSDAIMNADVGTLGYQAPEQWRKARVSPKMDVYALGLTAGEARNGSFPRKKAFDLGPLAIKEFIVAGKEGHPDMGDAHLTAVCKRMTMVKPEERGSMLDVMTDLSAYRDARAIYDQDDREAIMANLVARCSDLTRRHPLLDAAAAAGLLRDGVDPERQRQLEAIKALSPDINRIDAPAPVPTQEQLQPSVLKRLRR